MTNFQHKKLLIPIKPKAKDKFQM